MGESDKAVFRVVIRGSIEAVWHEITKTDELQKCMFNMRLETNGLKPGGQIRMRSPSGKTTGVVGEVLEFDPPRRYVHTFRFTQFDDPACTVIHELREVPEGVEYTLTHANLPAGTKTAKQMNQGGAMICATLKAIVETGRPSFGVRLLHVLFKLLEPLTPKKCRSENWPVDRQI
ncbi:MAG: SRPBCC domain-containing protein [Planctomycetes bacterium]|nr:SRPBCC domain-containing protein [Planctomycetota bacterium]